MQIQLPTLLLNSQMFQCRPVKKSWSTYVPTSSLTSGYTKRNRQRYLECRAHQDQSCVHSHSGGSASHNQNPAHKTLDAIFKKTGFTSVTEWLEESIPSTVAKLLLFTAAALSAWYSNRCAAHQVAMAALVSKIATVGVYILAGIPAAVDLLYDVTAGRVDTHVLMNLAVLGTLVTGHPLEGALLLILFQTSHVVEHVLTAKAQGNLKVLYDAAPQNATIVNLNEDQSPDMASIHTVRAADVAVGSMMLIKPGESVPLDGTIVHGRALVSSEHITGESIPVLRKAGDEIAAGSLNRDGLLIIQATRLAEESTPARIAKLAMEAQAERPRLKSWLDVFGETYSKAVIAGTLFALAVMLGMGIPLLSTSPTQRGAFYRAMGLLTVASPCALVMTPLAYVSAIAAIASRGVILRGGRVLDALANIKTVAFDKTGTLTTGSLICTSIKAVGGGGEASGRQRRAAIAAAAAVSLRSAHPVSDAVVLLAGQQGVEPQAVKVDNFLEVAGGGVTAKVLLPPMEVFGQGSQSGSLSVDDEPLEVQVSFGSFDFVRDKLRKQEVSAIERSLSRQGKTGVISVLVLEPTGGTLDNRSVWSLSFEDSVRRQSASAVEILQTGSWRHTGKNRRINVVMLTGDNAHSASRIAKKLGIERYYAALSPEQKLAHVKNLSAGEENGGGVIMVGDGLNDAAALAAADVGVAIASTGSAAASLAADAVVMNSSGIASIPLLLQVSSATQNVIKQNLALAIGSIVALTLPTVLGFIPLWVAVALHEGSTLVVALNSLRLLRIGNAMKIYDNEQDELVNS